MRPCQAGPPIRAEYEVASPEDVLRRFPVGTRMGRQLADSKVNVITILGKVRDFFDPYWRGAYLDGDWEELPKRGVVRRKSVAAQSSQPSGLENPQPRCNTRFHSGATPDLDRPDYNRRWSTAESLP